jgi:hypothetical protein
MNIVVSINKLFKNAYKALNKSKNAKTPIEQEHQVDSEIMKNSLILGRTRGYGDFLPDRTWKWYGNSDKKSG